MHYDQLRFTFSFLSCKEKVVLTTFHQKNYVYISQNKDLTSDLFTHFSSFLLRCARREFPNNRPKDKDHNFLNFFFLKEFVFTNMNFIFDPFQ